MRAEDIKKLEESKKYYQKWVGNLGDAQNLAPEVSAKIEQLDWTISALKDVPGEAEGFYSPSITTNIDRDWKLLPSALPMMPEYSSAMFSPINSTAGTITASVFVYVAQIGELNTPESQSFSEKYTNKFNNLELSQRRQDDVRTLLVKLGNQTTLERFDKAKNSYLQYKCGVDDKVSTANLMRNLIDGVQGALFEKARKHPKDNMNWSIMSRRLIKVGSSKEEIDTLLDQHSVRSGIISDLSNVLKDRDQNSVVNLEYIWTQLLQHIYVVLNLIVG